MNLRKTVSRICVCVLVAGSAYPLGHSLKAESTDWPVNGGDFFQQHFSPLAQITADNVESLGLAWVLDIDSPMGLAAEPIVVDGVIFLSAPQSIVYAVDAVTGRLLWRHDPKVRLDISLDSSYAARVNRGVAVSEGRVFVGTGDCRLVAMDAKTGSELWSNSVCDPRQTGITGAPRAARGKVFIGYNGSDDQVRGSIAAFDAVSGREVWRFWTVPGDPSKGPEAPALESVRRTWEGQDAWWHGGGTVWDAITFDPVTGLLLFGTSTAHRGEGTTSRPTARGAKLYSGCIVAVNADTGQYVWHVQTSTPERQVENFHIAIADMSFGGKPRHVAMSVPRNGVYYVLDASTGAVLSKTPVIAQGSAARSTNTAAIEAALPGATIIGEAEECDGCWGVHNWWPMSFSPASGLTYIPVMDRPAPSERTDTTPPFVGRLTAWDPVRRNVRWSAFRPLAINSGVLSTGGNLVFQGEGTGEFDAYQATTGRKLWSVQTHSAIDAVPISFAVNGEQYILVPVGWGAAARMFVPARMMTTERSKRGPARLLAFKLGGTIQMPHTDATIAAVPRPPTLSASLDSIGRGKELAESHLCTSCHSPQFAGSGAWTEDGAIPDLRFMPEATRAEWYAIVLGGSHRLQGMMAFGVEQHFPEMSALTKQDADDIYAYLVQQSWKAYEGQRPELAERK